MAEKNSVQVAQTLPSPQTQSSMPQTTSGVSTKLSQPQPVPTVSHTPASPMPSSNGAAPPALSNGTRIQLDQPPNPRVKGQPLRVPQSSPSSTPSHWRRQRRASDVIDSSRMHTSPSAPSELGSSLPRELLLGGPRTPTSPRSPLSDGGYGSSVFASPVSPTRDQKDAYPTGAEPIPPVDEHHSRAIAPMFVEKDAEEYNMKHTRRGRAIIINNDSFQMAGMADRLGSEVDVKSLKSAFETLQFDVTVYDNLCYMEITNVLQQLATEDHSDADCFCISVMTHGIANGYLLSRDVPYTVQSLWQPFTADKCPTLAGKPKLFFIQACRGDQLDSGVALKRRSRTQTDSSKIDSYKIPSNSDFLLSYSSTEGYFSWRNPENGTWFIQCLSEELISCGHKMDILRILTRVSRRVALDHESFNDMIPWENQCKQIPSFNSMLIRDLIFHPKE